MEQNDAPESLYSYATMVWAGIASVGWYILGAGVVLFLAAFHLKDKYMVWKRKKDEADYAAKYHKNPDLWEQRQRSQEEAIQRMQEKYNAAAIAALKIEEERKEAKRQEIANLMANQGSGRRLGTAAEGASTSKSSSKLQNDYNPLMGDSNRGYRPPKRSACGKGGCG